MKFLKSFGRFWYDFIIGDDPKIAVAVVAALALLLAALKARLFGDHGLAVLGAVALVGCFTISLVIDLRAKKSKR
jgi:Flp pilus assembly pilin Flp